MVNYKNGNVYVSIDKNTGTKIRFSKEDDFHPSFAESMDVNITYKCNNAINCPYCYLDCKPNGKHADLMSDYVVNTFIPSLHPYTELALNGNDLDIPYILEFLELLKKQKVFANITVNQNQFMANLDKLGALQQSNLVHGIGISFKEPDINFFRAIKLFKNIVIHTITGITDISSLKGDGLNILILGYKDKGRGIFYTPKHATQIIENIEYLKSYLYTYKFKDDFKGIGFDTLATKQLGLKDILSKEDWELCYQGDDGTFTYYVDLVNNKFAKSSTSNDTYSINNKTNDEMFNFIRGLNNAEKGDKN